MAFVLPAFTAAASALSGVLGGGAAAAAGAGAAGGLSLGSIGTVVGLGSSVLGVVGQLQAGNAAKAAAEREAQVAEVQSRQVQDQGAAKATEIAQRTRAKLSATRAGATENNLEISGSVTDVLDSVSKAGALDQMTALYDSSNRAASLRMNADLDRARAKNASAAGYLGAGQSLLTGFSRLYQA